MREQTEIRGPVLDQYRSVVEDGLLDEIAALARDLSGARIAHINATATGGGVAEILQSLIPLYRSIGVDARWLVLEGEDDFFQVTKQTHNSLQGSAEGLTQEDWGIHRAANRRNAASMPGGFDVAIVHDPQPILVPQFHRSAAKRWIWRSHIDTSQPNPETWRVLETMLPVYDALVFSMPEFVGPNLSADTIAIIPPAIDPLAPKNQRLQPKKARGIVSRYGLDTNRPFIVQVSRFDPWKDPVGVIECFKLLKKDHPDLQLAMLGNFADDDPEGLVVYEQVLEAAVGVRDLHIITGLSDLVGPFQQEAAVVLQKSVREGFGLTVTEALWKGTPVVAGNVGGIRIQLPPGTGGFLVDSVEECADRVDYLLRNEQERSALGASGREHVRQRFLLPRLLRDELRVLRAAVNATAPALMPSPAHAATEPSV